MDWDKLRIFHAVAQAGSFTHAGEALNLSQSAISRQISSLEKDLNTPLFHRHARGLVLTEQGELLQSTVADVMTKLQTVETLLAETGEQPTGELRITAPVAFGTVWLTPQMREFMELYPEIKLELILTDDHLDIAMREADVALWMKEPEQPDLIRRSLFSIDVHPYASASYLARTGHPHTIEDLESHRIVGYSGTTARYLEAIGWLETAGREHREPRVPDLRVNSLVAMKYAIRAGIGIGMLPEYLATESGGLVALLPDIERPPLPVLYVYPEELRGSKKVQLLRDFLVAKARRFPDWKGN